MNITAVLVAALAGTLATEAAPSSAIEVDQAGYRPQSAKLAPPLARYAVRRSEPRTAGLGHDETRRRRCAPRKAYVDETGAYACNEIAINSNAPLVFVLAALQ